jgi:hypothetical protein
VLIKSRVRVAHILSGSHVGVNQCLFTCTRKLSYSSPKRRDKNTDFEQACRGLKHLQLTLRENGQTQKTNRTKAR